MKFTALTVVIVFVTIFEDHKKGYFKGTGYTLVGLVFAMLCVLIESLSTYFVVSISGIFIGIGMTILLVLNLIKTIHDIQAMESSRQKIEMDERRNQMEAISLQMMQTLSTTIEAKDEYTRGHSHRVAEYAVLIAEELGWDKKEIRNLRNAAHLYDIGRIGIPDSILNKPTRLTEEEYAVIKEHTIIGAEILKNITLIDHVKEVARSHHERYDGKGYPRGLKGEDIPLLGRILAVCDSFDAMTTKRTYKEAMSIDYAISELEHNKGTQFDPKLAEAFIELLKEGKIEV